MEQECEAADRKSSVKRWGFMSGDCFVPVPKEPLVAAGYTTPPFDVVLPSRAVRRIIEEPDSCAPIGAEKGNP